MTAPSQPDARRDESPSKVDMLQLNIKFGCHSNGSIYLPHPGIAFFSP